MVSVAIEQPALSSGFTYPTFDQPIDISAQLARIPRDSTVKGLFFQNILKHGAQNGHVDERRYVGLIDYPNKEYTQLVFDVAAILHPQVPLREALRRLGHEAFPALKTSLWGRAVFGVLAHDLVRLFGLVSKGWEMSQSHAQARLISSEVGRAHIEISRCFAMLDCYVVGIFEGIILAADKEAYVGVMMRSETDCELECLWR